VDLAVADLEEQRVQVLVLDLVGRARRMSRIETQSPVAVVARISRVASPGRGESRRPASVLAWNASRPLRMFIPAM
jgi:hypothetical protein